jgi:hypothetical protein
MRIKMGCCRCYDIRIPGKPEFDAEKNPGRNYKRELWLFEDLDLLAKQKRFSGSVARLYEMMGFAYLANEFGVIPESASF